MTEQTEGKDGGPAFPVPRYVNADGETHDSYEGMSLRDYFAIHADQPGAIEILAAAGLLPDDPHQHSVVFAKWWHTLTNAERFYWYAKVRFGMADAMLAQRTKPREVKE